MIRVIVTSTEEAEKVITNLQTILGRVRLDYKLINADLDGPAEDILEQMITGIVVIPASDSSFITFRESPNDLLGCSERYYPGPMPSDGTLKE